MFVALQDFEKEASVYKTIIHKGGFLNEQELQ
jgi:hypothetical protein